MIRGLRILGNGHLFDYRQEERGVGSIILVAWSGSSRFQLLRLPLLHQVTAPISESEGYAGSATGLEVTSVQCMFPYHVCACTIPLTVWPVQGERDGFKEEIGCSEARVRHGLIRL